MVSRTILTIYFIVGILGNTSLVLDELAPDHPWRELLQGVMSAGERAADLTRQLLAYAGKGRFVVSNVDVSEVAAETKTSSRRASRSASEWKQGSVASCRLSKEIERSYSNF